MAVHDWNIKERSTSCTATGKAFAEDEPFYTMLVPGPEGLVRQDLCEEAWQNRNDNIRPVSFWRSVFKPTPEKPPEPVAKEDAESELRRLLDHPEQSNPKLCYLLALLLERKRILRSREKTVLDGHPVVVYEHTDTQETFLIPEVDFNLGEIESLQSELSGSSHIFAGAETPAPSSDTTA
jgi:hypothetical protein